MPRFLGLFAIDAALEATGSFACIHEEFVAAESIATRSKRERQVLDALSCSRPTKTVAFELGISIRTVEVHRASGSNKTTPAAMGSRTQLTSARRPYREDVVRGPLPAGPT